MKPEWEAFRAENNRRHLELRRRDNIADLAQAQADINERLRDRVTRQAEAIARGFEALDRIRPGWRDGPPKVRIIQSTRRAPIDPAHISSVYRAYRAGMAPTATNDEAWVARALSKRVQYFKNVLEELRNAARRRGSPTYENLPDDKALSILLTESRSKLGDDGPQAA